MSLASKSGGVFGFEADWELEAVGVALVRGNPNVRVVFGFGGKGD